MTRIDFAELAASLLGMAEQLVAEWLPDGKREGREWSSLNPTRADSSRGSFKVNLGTGSWSDFATGDKGGDLVSLYAYINGIGQKEAADQLSERYHVDTSAPAPPKKRKQRRWTPVAPVPGHATDLPRAHYKYGKPSQVWTYRDSSGAPIGHVCRFDRTNSKGDEVKEIVPLTWCRDDDGNEEWRWRSFEPPRPLYGLDRLADRPDRTVLVVEGEKCADAGQYVLEDMAVIAWIGGAQGIAKIDWSPLEGRTVILWPDNDGPGEGAMTDIGGRLSGVAASVAVMPRPGEARPPKWDIADAIGDGLDAAQLREIIATAQPVDAPASPPEHEPDYRAAPSADPFDQAPFRCLGYDHGNFYYLPQQAPQVIELAANAHTSKNLLSLAPFAWWSEFFPGDKGGASWNWAVDSIIRKSYSVGIYDPGAKRGRGVWFDEGRTVLHRGDHLVVDGAHELLTRFDTHHIYEAAPRTDLTDADPLGPEDAGALLEASRIIAWEGEHSPTHLLFAGWCMLAPISGALQWRPHVLITGPSGSGKSFIVDNMVRPILGDASLYVLSNTTEAGIRQALGHDAFPVIFDEAEGEDFNALRRMDNVLELVRQASSSSGATIIKGSQGGKASKYNIRSCFCLASIGVGIRQRSDASRITVLTLGWHDREVREDLYEELKRVVFGRMTPTWCARFRARAVDRIPDIRANAETFARAASVVFGSRRMGDQIGSLIAGAWAVEHDGLISIEDATALFDRYDWTQFQAVEQETDEERCLNTVLQHVLTVNQDGRRLDRSVARLLFLAADLRSKRPNEDDDMDEEVSRSDADLTLRRAGIRYNESSSEIVISNNHRGVAAIMRDTPWSRGWHQILRRLDGATDISSFRFEAGTRSRAVAIPASKVFGEGG